MEDSSLLCYLKKKRIDVGEILEAKDFYLRSMIQLMDEKTRSMLMGLCASLVRIHGLAYAPLFHSGYFFQSNYKIICTAEGTDVTFGQVDCGQVLEIIHDETSAEIIEGIIQQMKNQCISIGVSNNISPKLIDYVRGKVVRISVGKNQLEVSHSEDVTETIEMHSFNGSTEQLFIDLYQHLIDIIR